MDSSYMYTFYRWRLGTSGNNYYTTDFPSVSSNRDFYATYFQLQYYTLTIKDWDNTILYQEKYMSGAVVPEPIDGGLVVLPSRESDDTYSYTFWNWTTSVSNTVIASFPKKINSNYTVYARYRTDQYHTVTFTQDGTNGEVLDVQTILDLDDAVDPITSGRIATPLKSSTAQFQYTFREWNRGFTAVTGDITVKAIYSSETRSYTVTFVDNDTDAVLFADTALYNTYVGSLCLERVDRLSNVGFDTDYYYYKPTPDISSILVQTDVTVRMQKTYATISDSWATIKQHELQGDYKERYSIGDTKYVGDGGFFVKIVAFDQDLAEDGSYAPITWIAITPPSVMSDVVSVRSTSGINGYKITEASNAQSSLFDYFTASNGGSRSFYSTFSIVVNNPSNTDKTITIEHFSPNNDDPAYKLFCHLDGSFYTCISPSDNDLVITVPANSENYEIYLCAEATMNPNGNYYLIIAIKLSIDDQLEVVSENEQSSSRKYFYPSLSEFSWATRLEREVCSTLLNQLDDQLQGMIIPVKKYSAKYTNSGSNNYALESVLTIDELWLPSLHELGIRPGTLGGMQSDELTFNAAYSPYLPRDHHNANRHLYFMVPMDYRTRDTYYSIESFGTPYVQNGSFLANVLTNTERDYKLCIGFCT